MTESPLMIKSKEFALTVVKVCKELLNKCIEVKRILIASINTAKENTK